jgi:hypothetical protein
VKGEQARLCHGWAEGGGHGQWRVRRAAPRGDGQRAVARVESGGHWAMARVDY